MRRSAAGWMLALGAMLASSSGCKHAPAAAQTADAGAAAPGLTPEQSARVLARVGDRAITVGDYVAALEHMDEFDRMRYRAPERREHLLAEMIDVALLADEARAQGYDRDPTTQQEIREILRDAMLEKARAGAPAPSDVPDDQARAYYEAHKDAFHDPERRRVSVVATATRAAAEALLGPAEQASAVEWGELVRSKSTEADASAGVPADLAGDLGFVGPPGDPRGANPRVPEAVRSAVFEIPAVGGVLPRVVAAGGAYYVVKLASRTDPHDRTFDEAKRSIQIRLAADAARAKEDALVDELRRKYPVQIDESALRDVDVDAAPPDAGP